MFFQKASFGHIHGKRATAELNHYLERQAKALALDDCFYCMAWVCIILLMFIVFRKGPLLNENSISP